jgi:hypothetical protein
MVGSLIEIATLAMFCRLSLSKKKESRELCDVISSTTNEANIFFLILSLQNLSFNNSKSRQYLSYIKMTTPRWIKNAYVKSILAILLILCIVVTCVCLNSYDVFSSSALSSQDKERQEFSKTSSLKSLVAEWLNGESPTMLSAALIIKFSIDVC